MSFKDDEGTVAVFIADDQLEAMDLPFDAWGDNPVLRHFLISGGVPEEKLVVGNPMFCWEKVEGGHVLSFW